MSVKEVLQALGNWGITLRAQTPRELIKQIEQNKFGHIAILPGRINPSQYGDGLLREARYVGVYRSTFKQSDDTIEIKGVGMAFWLGDEDDKGAIFETPVVLDGVTFPNAIRALLPSTGSVKEGSLYSVPGAGTYKNTHQWETPRKAITYVTDTYTTSAEFTGTDRIVEYRVNGDATLDAGPIENLYVTTPKALLVKKDTGRDMRMLGLQADMSMDYDVEDLTTRLVLLAEGEGKTMATGSANATPTGFVDLFGTPIKMTRIVSESGTTTGNANTRAQFQLIRWTLPRQAIQIRTDEFDIKGDFAVGDYIYVFDPESGFFDLAEETFWRGQPVNPLALRVKEIDWGVRDGWTVAFRKNNGEWLDLSEYYKPESGGSTLAVGDYRRTLAGNNYEPISFRPKLPGADTTIPGAPTWDTFSTGSYQPESGEWTKAAVYASWFQPNNSDGSIITDGGHYEIRYRVSSYIGYGIRWGQLSGHSQLLSDSITRSVTNGWGPDYTTAGGANSEYLADGTRGVHNINALNSSRTSYLAGISIADSRITGSVSPSVTPIGGTYRLGYVLRRDAAGANMLRMEVRFNTDGTADLIYAKIGTGGGDLAIIGIGTFVPSDKFWIEFEAVGTSILGRAWKAGTNRPAWQVVTTESTITAAGNPAARSVLSSTMTNTLPVAGYYDDIVVTDLANSGGYRWGSLNTNKWGAPITEPVQSSGEWNSVYVGWGQSQMLIQELTPGVQYEFQIRAADSANPAHRSPWSTSEFVVASEDIFAPDVPAAPVVASSRIAIQVIHTLGKASGGAFNLQPDLVYLSVHVGGSDSFLADDTNMVGKLIANSGMLQGNIPAVGTFQIEQTDSVWVKVVAVDRAGNKSGASNAVQATVDLIDDAHISDLTVSKVTAGTITAEWLMAGSIKTATSGARVELTGAGIEAFDADGAKTVDINSSDGSATFTGKLQTRLNGAGIQFFMSGGRAYGYWSINDTAGVPLDHFVYSTAQDYGTLFGQSYEMGIRKVATVSQDGSKLWLTEAATVLSHQPASGQEAFLALGKWPYAGNSASGQPGMVYMQGRWGRANAINGEACIYTTLTDVAAGFGSLTLTYGPTFQDLACPITSLSAAAGAAVPHTVSGPNATGVTVDWTGTAAHRVYFWVYRMDNSA